MTTTVETRRRRSLLVDVLGAALVLACTLVFALGGWTTIRAGAGLFHLGDPTAVASAPAAPDQVVTCCLVAAR